MNIGVETEYIARDERRWDIPWIRVRDTDTGRETVYNDKKNPLTDEEIASATIRRMDCMDCHNRPSHKYRSPDYMVDLALLTGMIDSSLPDIKRLAVESMDQDYETEDEAHRGIANYIEKAYRVDRPDVFANNRTEIEKAVISVQSQYSKSIFPEMKVRWDEYPDNIGHFLFPGCVRCHDGNKQSEEGWVITTDCTSCHIIMAQGSGEYRQMALDEDGLEFVHPDDPDEEGFDDIACYECHSGIQP